MAQPGAVLRVRDVLHPLRIEGRHSERPERRLRGGLLRTASCSDAVKANNTAAAALTLSPVQPTRSRVGQSSSTEWWLLSRERTAASLILASSRPPFVLGKVSAAIRALSECTIVPETVSSVGGGLVRGQPRRLTN